MSDGTFIHSSLDDLSILGNTLIDRVLEQLGQGKTGCAVCIADPRRISLWEGLFGNPNKVEMDTWLECAHEQNRRLIAWPEHTMSFLSKASKSRTGSGAIRMQSNGLLISCAGLPEQVNTPFATYLGYRLGWVEQAYVTEQMRLCKGVQTYTQICDLGRATTYPPIRRI